MTVRANKPAFNIREKLKSLDSVTYDKMPAGSVIQVVQTEFRNTFSNTTPVTLAKVTGLSTTISPKLASSKLLIRCDVIVGTKYWQVVGRLYRNDERITDAEGIQAGARPQSWFGIIDYGEQDLGGDSAAYNMHQVSASYMDTADTTSTLTYDLYFGNLWSAPTPVYINRSHSWNNGSTYNVMPISTMTIMEIKQ
jgi:hypothetical protein